MLKPRKGDGTRRLSLASFALGRLIHHIASAVAFGLVRQVSPG
jgi:hypothetical protein